MGGSLQQLKLAQTRFVDSSDAVSKITTDSVNKEIFIPLSSSVSFNLGQSCRGAGHWVEKNQLVVA